MPLNTRLKLAFFEADVSQQVVALETQIHESRLSRIVRGWQKPSQAEKRLIAKALRRKVHELWPDDENSQAVA